MEKTELSPDQVGELLQRAADHYVKASGYAHQRLLLECAAEQGVAEDLLKTVFRWILTRG